MSATILIVDDDEDSRLMMRRAVEAERLRAVLAASGEEALELLRSEAIDLVLMDAIMPGLDGFESCKMIKANPATAHIPVIFMTGLTETAHVLRGLQAGGVDYVTKPLVLEELVARIVVHLGNARVAQRALLALDQSGGRIVASDDEGRIRWTTTQTMRMLDELGPEVRGDVERTMQELLGQPQGSPRTASVAIEGGTLAIAAVEGDETAEHLFSLSRSMEGGEHEALQEAFDLTRREAEVLLWISHGKSNRDTSEILNISARTVNKHLEQIFIKMGVENRASAASAATRIILARQ